MLGNNNFYIPNDTATFVHDSVHAELKASQDDHGDHTYWDTFNNEHLYCGRATIEPAQVDQNYLYVAGGASETGGLLRFRASSPSRHQGPQPII